MKEITHIVRVLGLQVESEYYLNPINISMNSNKLLKKLEKYIKNKYRFILGNFLFSSNFTNETDVIFLCCDSLSNAKETLINSELKKVLGVNYLSKVPNWSLDNGQTKRLQAIFVDSEFQTKLSHLAFAFTTRNLSDLLSFTVTLLDEIDQLKAILKFQQERLTMIIKRKRKNLMKGKKNQKYVKENIKNYLLT